MRKAATTAVIAVIFSSLMFGALGACTRYFHNDCGLSSSDIVVIRLTVSGLGLLIVLALFAREHLKIRKKDIPFMFIFGVFKFLTDVTFFFAQNNTSLCLATLLQMTAPYFVMVLSLIMFKERITMPKLMAMCVGSIGCVLVTGILFGEVDAKTEGIFAAIFSGLCIAMFFIGNRMAIDRDIRPTTMLLYTTLFADLIALPLAVEHGESFSAILTPTGIGVALAFGLIMTLIPYYILTWSTLHIEPTVISMISVLEVGAAAVVGYLMFGEDLTAFHILGIALVILSVILINVKLRLDYIKRYGKYVSPWLNSAWCPSRFSYRNITER